MHTFKLKILTPDTKLFEGEVESFTVPTQSGEITILKNHAPLITLISIGEIKCKTPGGLHDQNFLVQGGVIDVKSTSPEFEVAVLADQIVSPDKEDNFDAEIERAKEAMKVNAEDIDFALEESVIERNLFLKRLKGK
jgi:F-type H+-transporting ATPase subunit epsilon